jgi:hypothetical protein
MYIEEARTANIEALKLKREKKLAEKEEMK